MIQTVSMLTSGTTSSSGSASSSGTTTKSGSIASIGKDQFLTLLVTQLKNQDPMSPMQPNEFAAQLAQFTSVEQLIQLNTAVNDQSAAVQVSTLAGQAALGASLIGKQVVAEGNGVTIPATGQGSIRADIGGTGGDATITLKDSTGKIVATRDLGSVAAGHRTLTLPADLPAGDYSYQLTVKDSKQASVTVTTYTSGVVSAVEFDSGQIMLRLGGLKTSLGSIAEIGPAPDSSSTAARP
jgi:flagellar basal-body rod modification protein FlgD